MNIIFEFIERERYKYADINVFANNWEPALRYYDFLLIILDRYKEINDKYVDLREERNKKSRTKLGTVTRMTPEDGLLLVKSGQLTTLLHLEIESFYLFAKILLDNIVRFLYTYFGEEENIKLKSHDNLAKYHEKYFRSKGLSIPEGISENILMLKTDICDYRDKEISHELSLRRTKATSWSRSGGAKISSGIINPKPGEKTYATKELPILMDNINTYIQQIIKLIESNRAKSRLKFKDKSFNIKFRL